MKFMEILPTIVIERVVDLGFSAALLLWHCPLWWMWKARTVSAYIVGVVVIVGLVAHVHPGAQ